MIEDFKYTNNPDDYLVECDQCHCILEPYQLTHNICSECRQCNEKHNVFNTELDDESVFSVKSDDILNIINETEN